MWDAWHNASVWRGYHWHGIKPWQRNGYLSGYNLRSRDKLKTRVLDESQNRFRMFSYGDDEIEIFIRKLRKATFLGGYSSMIYEIAKAVNRNPNCSPLTNLKMIKGTSEKIFESYQQESIDAFGQRIVSEYGAAETGIIAFECESGRMHVNMETWFFEIEKDEIFVTNLASDSFPIIRYRLGDSISLDSGNNCECGRAHDIITEVTGRIGHPIYGRQSKYPSLTLYYVFKNLASNHGIILNYQAIQNQQGKLDLLIEGLIPEHGRLMLGRELDMYFSNDLDVSKFENADLRSQGKKKRDFVTTIA